MVGLIDWCLRVGRKSVLNRLLLVVLRFSTIASETIPLKIMRVLLSLVAVVLLPRFVMLDNGLLTIVRGAWLRWNPFYRSLEASVRLWWLSVGAMVLVATPNWDRSWVSCMRHMILAWVSYGRSSPAVSASCFSKFKLMLLRAAKTGCTDATHAWVNQGKRPWYLEFQATTVGLVTISAVSCKNHPTRGLRCDLS